MALIVYIRNDYVRWGSIRKGLIYLRCVFIEYSNLVAGIFYVKLDGLPLFATRETNQLAPVDSKRIALGLIGSVDNTLIVLQ